MNKDFGYLAALPGTPEEQAWLRDHLTGLSEREALVLEAGIKYDPPAEARDAVNLFLWTDETVVYPAPSGYEDLGSQALWSMGGSIPEEALAYVDLCALGKKFEEKNPGFFVQDHYVVYPPEGFQPSYLGNGVPLSTRDGGWGVRLKLTSPAKPEGVWLRLPDYPALNLTPGALGELDVARRSLQVNDLEECALLDAWCVLPEAGNLMEQYGSAGDLIRDGTDLGLILREKSQYTPAFDSLYAAALEYEDCCTLRYALDIAENLQCYEWVPSDGLDVFSKNHLRSCGVSDELIQSGCIDLKSYAEDLLETSGYMLTRNESGYVTRNTRKFIFEYCTQEEADGLTETCENAAEEEEYVLPENLLGALPDLAGLADRAEPSERAEAEQMIREALEGRGPEGLRHLQAAIDYECCSTLNAAAQIAAHLNCYAFTDEEDFREKTRQELMEKGLSRKVIEFCFKFDDYAMIKLAADDVMPSRSTGLYVHKTDQSFQPICPQECGQTAGLSM